MARWQGRSRNPCHASSIRFYLLPARLNQHLMVHMAGSLLLFQAQETMGLGRGQEIMVGTRFKQSTTSEVPLSGTKTPDELKAGGIGGGNNERAVSCGQVCRHWYYLVFKMEHAVVPRDRVRRRPGPDSPRCSPPNALETLRVPIDKHLKSRRPSGALSRLCRPQQYVARIKWTGRVLILPHGYGHCAYTTESKHPTQCLVGFTMLCPVCG